MKRRDSRAQWGYSRLKIRLDLPKAEVAPRECLAVTPAAAGVQIHDGVARPRVHLELVEEVDLVLETLLVQGLEDHVAGAVGGVAGAVDRLAVRVLRVGCPAGSRSYPPGNAARK